MYPTNHYMDPYSSYYRHHAPYPYYPPPAWEPGRQQMPEADSSCRPPYGPWAYSGSMNHSGVPDSHSCCNHTYPPGYYSFRPPFPQELPPPPPPVYYHGPFPPHHPNPCSPSSYFGPMPPYPVDQTPYNGYDKFKSHCCGCPNHVCHGGQKSNVKIEEHMPEAKPESNQKGADNSTIIRNPNYQYPIMWLPPGSIRDKGDGTSFEVPPQLFSKWFPRSGERTEDVKPADDNQEAKQLQWPIVWMPPGYDGTQQQAKKDLKEIEQNPKNMQEDPPSPKIKKTQEDPPSPKIKIIPLSWFGNDQKPAARDGSGEQNGRSSAAKEPAGTQHQQDKTVDGNMKTIPVVPEKPNSGHEPAISAVPEKQDAEKKVRTIPVMAQKESDEKKSYMGGNKEEKKAILVEKEGETKKSNNVESSKAKPSKLPPVCLRVDPLPKKKSGNATSRSSNPAPRKLCQKDKDVKEAQGKNQETKLSEHQKEGNVLVKEKSSNEIRKVTGSRNVTVLDASMKHTQEEQSSTSMTDQKVQPSISAEARENVSVNSLQECNKKRKEDELKIQGEASNLASEIKLSEPDAAVRIQSAYRGYYVRRWQPLEKLRKIKNVHRQMQDVEKQLQALEASSKQPTEKEHIATNETIMNLLLNLDTIQGLHPVVREARKSVARQLVCLQEKLDSLCNKLSAEPNNHAKSEEVSLTGVDEEKLPATVNSREPMHDDVSLEVSLKLSQEGDSTEQKKHQMEESSTANEEARDKGEAAAPPEFEGVSPMDVMCDAASSGLITDKKHQMEETSILREECTEDEKTARKGEGSSDLYMEGSVLKQGTPSADQNSNAEESDEGVSLTTTEDGTTAISTASLGSEVAVDDDGSAEEGGQLQECAPVGISCLKHDAAPAEDHSKEPSAPFLHLEDSSVSSEVADPHGNDPALADDPITTNPGEKQEESIDVDMQKEVADDPLDSGKEPNGTPTAPVGDTGVTGANAESSTQEEIALVGPETTKQCEVSHEDDSAALVDQQNELHVEDPASSGSAIVEETEAVPLEVEGKKTMDNAMNDAIGEEPEAVPLESKVMTMENTVNEEPESVSLEIEDKKTMEDAGSLPSNTSAEPALPESTGYGSPCGHDSGVVCGDNPDSMVSPESQGDLQEEKDDDGGKVSASDATEGDGTMLAETLACATGANSAVPVAEVEMPKEGAEGVPTEEEAEATIPATDDGTRDVLKSADDDGDKNKGLTDENQKLREMLEKLLTSGNDQMGLIAELSDKVKTLERKLARKRRPKVRVQRGPARNATAADSVH